MTPLQIAAEAGHGEIVSILLEAGADADRLAGEKGAPLFLAVSNGHFGAAGVLLRAGADTERRDVKSGESPIEAAWSRLQEAARLGEQQQVEAVEGWLEQVRLQLGANAVGQPATSETAQARARDPGPRRAASGTEKKTREPRPFAPLADLGPRSAGRSSWRPLDPARKLPERIDGQLRTSPRTTSVDECRLSWYRDHHLVRLWDPAWGPRLAIFYLAKPAGSWTRLDGTSPGIHRINAVEPVDLDGSNAADYLRFFCYFVRGAEGPFYIIESAEDPLLPEIDPALREHIAQMIDPMRRVETAKALRYEAFVLYSNALFRSTFEVERTGMVKMISDEPMLASLPFRLEVPITAAAAELSPGTASDDSP